MDNAEYKISSHAEVRYSERIMGKDNKNDVNRFIVENKEKIKTDINKMIKYGNLIFTGKQHQKDGKGNVVDVFLKDTWIIIADSAKSRSVITLYKIDLGLDDEFNKLYIEKMVDKLKGYQQSLEDTKAEVQKESDTYKELIDDAEDQIKHCRSTIKNLEELCAGYKSIIENNVVKVSQANRNVVDTLNTLIGRREF